MQDGEDFSARCSDLLNSSAIAATLGIAYKTGLYGVIRPIRVFYHDSCRSREVTQNVVCVMKLPTLHAHAASLAVTLCYRVKNWPVRFFTPHIKNLNIQGWQWLHIV